MTDTRLTQIAVEQWASGTPAMQLTQVAVEQWGSVTAATVQAVMTQIAIEQWASVAVSGGASSQARAMMLA